MPTVSIVCGPLIYLTWRSVRNLFREGDNRESQLSQAMSLSQSSVCVWKRMNQYKKYSNGSSVFKAIQIYSWLQTSNELLWNWKDLQLGKKTMQHTAWSPLLLLAWLATRIISWWQCDSPSSNYEALHFQHCLAFQQHHGVNNIFCILEVKFLEFPKLYDLWVNAHVLI